MDKYTEKLTNPKFLLCEKPIKTGDQIQDNRSFIYCPYYLSLIEIVPLDLYLAAFDSEQIQKEFQYQDETFLLVFTQNNVDIFNETNEIEIMQGKEEPMTSEKVLDEAWEWYKKYLVWEDEQMK